MCTNTAFKHDITACVATSCAIKEAFFTKNTTETACHAPIRDKSQRLENLAIVLGVITAAMVAGQLLFKAFMTRLCVTLDDWVILACLLIGIPSTVMAMHGVGANGIGRDIWMLPYDTITRFGMYMYVMEVLYFVELVLFKMSILFFYL
ncbi:hypothetical protein VTO42DRAFT_3709 [Malbranchea cinnamomea]